MSQPVQPPSAALWCPRHIDVIGGGLWSRVITETLCGMVPAEVVIGIHTPGNHPALLEWAERMKLTGRVRTTAEWPHLESDGSRAIIIANAARSHATAAERVLPSRVPVLVEKPLTLSTADSQRLIQMAAQAKAPLAASHVFLFSRYVPYFASLLAQEDAIRHVAFRWSDPKAEIRHGDRKSYDAGLPLHVDVLPHISSLVGALLPGRQQSCTGIEVLRGGAQMKLELNLDAASCSVELARNASRRERVIEVITESKKLILDFTAEPHVILGDGAVVDADLDWNTKERPLACMLRAFLKGASSGSLDPRFSVTAALQANMLADQVTPSYRKTVHDWLSEELPRQTAQAGEGLRYALRELFHARRRAEASDVDARVEEALRSLRGARPENVTDFIAQET
jgi:predicted dehydrogenase